MHDFRRYVRLYSRYSRGLDRSHTLAAYRQGLSDTGYVEAQNVAIDYRWAEGKYEQLPAMAADLVRRKVAVIVTSGSPTSAVAAKAATSTIPIVCVVGFDPVTAGLIASLNRPGGNITGVTLFAVDLAEKRLELLREILTRVGVIGLLVNPNSPNAELELRNGKPNLDSEGKPFSSPSIGQPRCSTSAGRSTPVLFPLHILHLAFRGYDVSPNLRLPSIFPCGQSTDHEHPALQSECALASFCRDHHGLKTMSL